MTESNDLLTGLWALFRAEISTGEPVFFCFSQENLKSQLSEKLLSGQSPLSVVCAAARACYDIQGDDVLLRPGVLSSGKTGFSMAVVLVCQQVLAVEEMVRDGSGYSENAYFPRLRSLISPQLAQLSQNPFGFYEFELIWRTFASEIRSIPGGSEDSVTFVFGAYSGINKARSFPLSQALLSRADLAELVNQCRLERLRTGSAKDVWIETRRERNHLTRRGQRLVNSGFLRDRLVEQIQNYARRSVARPATQESLQQARLLELAVCLDVSDWPNEEYAAFLTDKGTMQRVDDDRQIQRAMATALGERGYAFGVLCEFGDYWSFGETARQVGAGDTILLLATSMGIERGRAVLGGLSPPVPIDDARIRTLGDSSKVRVCPVTFPASLNSIAIVRAGRISRDAQDDRRAIGYEWLGGICVDRRTRKYLREALPIGVRFGDREFRIDQLTCVGKSPMGWERLERAIQELEGDASYELQFGSGYGAQLSIASERTAESNVGFLIDRNGLLSPTLEQVGQNDPAVIGFSQKGDQVRSTPVEIVALLLQDLKTGQGRLLTPVEAQSLIDRVEHSSVPRNVKRVIRRMLDSRARVRETTLQRALTTDSGRVR